MEQIKVEPLVSDLVMLNDRKMRLVVEVSARIEWVEPPKNPTEEAMRERSNNMARKAGVQLEPSVQLLVAALLDAQAHNAKLSGRATKRDTEGHCRSRVPLK